MTDFTDLSDSSQFTRDCQEANRIADRLRGIKRPTQKRENSVATSVYEFLRAFFAENDQLPPAQTIAAHFGWRSHTRAVEILRELTKRGLIEHNSLGKYRFTREQEAANV